MKTTKWLHAITIGAIFAATIAQGAVEYVDRGGFSGAFRDSLELEKVTMSKVKFVGYEAFCGAFSGCKKLSLVDFSRLPAVGIRSFSGCFKNCESLKKISFPSVLVVDSQGFSEAFRGCRELRKVQFPNLVAVAPDGFNDAFANCPSLNEIYFDKVETPFDIGIKNSGANASALKIFVPNGSIEEWKKLNSGYGYCFVAAKGSKASRKHNEFGIPDGVKVSARVVNPISFDPFTLKDSARIGDVSLGSAKRLGALTWTPAVDGKSDLDSYAYMSIEMAHTKGSFFGFDFDGVTIMRVGQGDQIFGVESSTKHIPYSPSSYKAFTERADVFMRKLEQVCGGRFSKRELRIEAPQEGHNSDSASIRVGSVVVNVSLTIIQPPRSESTMSFSFCVYDTALHDVAVSQYDERVKQGKTIDYKKMEELMRLRMERMNNQQNGRRETK